MAPTSLTPDLRREWGFAPLCGARATFSGSSKDPSRPLQGERELNPNKKSSPLPSEGMGEAFIANGDVAVVRRFRNERQFYGFRFADATLRFPDYDNIELDVTVLLDTLQSEAPALTRQQQEQLFNAVWDDYPEIRDKRERMKRLRQDPYYNALQIKYAYAITCHKAQGGQWQHVYIDQGYITEEMLTPDYFRWLYTALTRATEKVFLVNWPKEQIE